MATKFRSACGVRRAALVSVFVLALAAAVRAADAPLPTLDQPVTDLADVIDSTSKAATRSPEPRVESGER